MEIIQAFKYQLRRSKEQLIQLSCYAGSCRFVFNKALVMQQKNHEMGGKFIGHVEMAKHLTAWRNGEETPWLKDSPVHPLQHALKNLDVAFKNFFAERSGFHKFKKKGMGDSFRYPDPKQIRLDQQIDRIFLPKLGWMRYRNSRPIICKIRNATVSLRGSLWREGAVRPLIEAGTHRSYSGSRLIPVGIPVLPA